MRKKFITPFLMLGVFITDAQANITIPGSHTSNLQKGVIETYFIKANATGSADIYVDQNVRVDGSFFNGFLSVWQLVGSNWSLVGANNDAPEVAPYLLNSYGVTIEGGVSGIPGQGQSDSGLTLNLTANSTYMIVQSEDLNGPSSLDDQGNGTFGQSIAVGSNYINAFKNGASTFYDSSNGSYVNSYTIFVNGAASLTTAPAIKKTQLITFVAVPTITVGKTGVISASTDSKLTISYTATPKNICTINGNTITGNAVGVCTITASQAGNANYNSAQKTQNISVGKGAQNISFGAAPIITVGNTGKISASTDSKLTISYTATPKNICTINGNTITGNAVGVCTITASQAGNANYNSAQKTQKISVGKGAQTINFGAAPILKVGKTGSISATSTSKLTVSLTAAPATICTLKGNIITAKTVGTCVITAKQLGTVNYNPAPTKNLSIQIKK